MTHPMPETHPMSETRMALIGAFMVTLGPLSLTLYTPAMPMLVEAFRATPASVNMTMTVYFLGFAFAQLVCGPLSDAYGRRPVALSFFLAYAAGSLACALSPSVGWLIAGRALQGVGAAAGIAISRAMVRDGFTGQASARILNLIGLMLAVAPAVAPTLGAVMAGTVGWHGIFVAMLAYGVALLAVFAACTRETNAARSPALARPGLVLGNYAALLGDRRFMRAGLVMGLSLGGTYTLIAFLPFVMIGQMGMSPVGFGLATTMQTAAYVLGAAVTGRLLRRVQADRLVPVGLAFVGAGALGYGVGLRLLPLDLVTVTAPGLLWSFGIALVMPGATTVALGGFPRIAGAAAALVGFLQIGGGLAGTGVSALLFADPFQAMTTVMPAMALMAAAAHLALGPARGQGG